MARHMDHMPHDATRTSTAKGSVAVEARVMLLRCRYSDMVDLHYLNDGELNYNLQLR